MVEIEIGVLKGQCLDRRINNQKDSSGNRRLAARAATPPAHA